MFYTIPVDPTIEYQIISINLPYVDRPLNVRIELRYLEYVDRWYFSLYDAQTGNPYCLYVPVLVCDSAAPNNLLEQYTYKEIGLMACVSKTSDNKTGDPAKDTLGEFYLLWGDGLAE